MSLYSKAYKFVVRHKKVKQLTQKALFAYRHVYMWLIGRLRGIDRKKIVFSSFQASGYNDNPRYISEMIHKMDPSIKQVWLIRDEKYKTVELPEYVIRAHSMGRDGLDHMATARCWVDNMKKNPAFYFDPRRQIYFNTWHGDRGFKRVGNDNEKAKKQRAIEEMCTGMIAGSEFGRNTYRTAFNYQGEVLMDGCPRNDILLRNDPAQADEIRRRMNIPEDLKLLVYAPTFRDEMLGKCEQARLDIPRTLDILEKKTGGKWACLLRAHFRSLGLDADHASDRIINVTDWPEMAEILLISDMLITDYSSCAGDFVLQEKPAILFQPDADEYNRSSRSFYFDMDTAPFFIARDMDALEKIISGLTEASVRENCRQWNAFFKVTETGHAAEASAKFILERM